MRHFQGKRHVPVQLLRLLRNLELLSFFLYIAMSVRVRIDGREPDSPERDGRDVPRSLMLKTPGTLELALRFSLTSEARPWTAESTLVKGSVADMMMVGAGRGYYSESRMPSSEGCISRGLIVR